MYLLIKIKPKVEVQRNRKGEKEEVQDIVDQVDNMKKKKIK